MIYWFDAYLTNENHDAFPRKTYFPKILKTPTSKISLDSDFQGFDFDEPDFKEPNSEDSNFDESDFKASKTF